MTKEEAAALAKSEFWRELSDRERAVFQLHESRLCMPFEVFHGAVEKTLGRPVWTHEFADPKSLVSELEGKLPAPDMAGIIAKLADLMGSK